MKQRNLLVIFLFLFFFGHFVTAETVKISIGVQPPLLSEAGGIVNLVIAEALSRGEYAVDIYVTPSNTPGQQNAHVDFLAANGVFFYLTKKTPVKKITCLEDLSGKTVGTVTNSPLKAMFEKAGIIVDEGPFETMFLKLDNGRVDFVSTADVGGLLTIRKIFPGRESDFDFTDFSYTVIATGLYVKPGVNGEKLLNCARKGFASMKADGTLDRMLRDFFGPIYASRVKVY